MVTQNMPVPQHYSSNITIVIKKCQRNEVQICCSVRKKADILNTFVLFNFSIGFMICSFFVLQPQQNERILLNPLATIVLHHIETSQLIRSANQLTGFYMMGKTGRQWVKHSEGCHLSRYFTRIIFRNLCGYFISLSGFSFAENDDSKDSKGREGTRFYSSLPLLTAHEYSDIYMQLCM